MRKLVIFAALILTTGILSGQSLKKDALISIHTLEISLEDGVTMDQYLDFMVDEFFTLYKKTYSCDVRLVKGLNREIEGRIGVMVHFKSKQEWNRFFNDDGTMTEAGRAGWEKIRPALDELRKLGAFRSENVVDWVIQ